MLISWLAFCCFKGRKCSIRLKIKITSHFFESYFVKNGKVSKASMKTLKVFVFEGHHPSTVSDKLFAVLWIENKGFV